MSDVDTSTVEESQHVVVQDDKKTKRLQQLADARRKKKELKQQRDIEFTQMKTKLDSLLEEKKTNVVQKEPDDSVMTDTEKPVKITKDITTVVQKEPEQDFYVDFKNQVFKTAFTSCLALGSWYLSQKYAPVRKSDTNKPQKRKSPYSLPPLNNLKKKKIQQENPVLSFSNKHLMNNNINGAGFLQ
jgi:membrane-bound lytic murein transglycosylase